MGEKTLFVIGDSISVQYGPYLKQMLQGVFSFRQKEGQKAALENLDIPVGGNGGDSRMVLQYLKEEYKKVNLNYDLMTINCGLHDIKRDIENNKIQVPLEEYEMNLKEIINLMQKAGITMIWVRTTPVEDNRHNSIAKEFKRYNEDAVQYNSKADNIMTEHCIPMIDLYTFSKNLGSNAYCDHVHYCEEARALQAAFIAGKLYDYER